MRGTRGPPPLYRFVSDRTGQSETIAIVLLLAITLIGASLTVTLGGDALADTQRNSGLERTEHSLTRFDSQAAVVALGDSGSQRVSLGPSGGGEYVVDDDAGWLRITHENFSGTDDEVLFNRTLGEVRYVNENTTIAYQGGGVWRETDGGVRMVSPPEFHYRGATLTLPVVTIANEDNRSGPTTAVIQDSNDVERVFPNDSETYADGNTYMNPITEGEVYATVKSDYYEGWAEYFQTRTGGNVTVDHANNTATVELTSITGSGPYAMSDAFDSDGVSIRGVESGHSTNEFDAEFHKSGGTFSNTYFSFYGESGDRQYEVVIHVQEGTSCNGGVDSSDELSLYYFYRDDDTGGQHEWSNESLPADSGPIHLDCNDEKLVVDLMNDRNLTYSDIAIDAQGTHYAWDESFASEADFNHTGDDGEDTRFVAGNETTSRHLMRHYVAKMDSDFALHGRSGTGNRGSPQVDLDDSSGTFSYDSGGESYLTFLHVTENEIEVDLE